MMINSTIQTHSFGGGSTLILESSSQASFPASKVKPSTSFSDNPHNPPRSIRGTEKVLIALCLLLLVVSTVFSSQYIGYGPRIKGAQLGAKMSINDLVMFLINLDKLPFTIVIKNDVTIKFNGNGHNLTSFKITNTSRSELKNNEGILEELLTELEDIGVENTSIYLGNDYRTSRKPSDIISFDTEGRVASLKLYKSDFVASSVSSENFLRAFTSTYNIPYDENFRRHFWQYENSSECWQIRYYDLISEGVINIEPLTIMGGGSN